MKTLTNFKFNHLKEAFKIASSLEVIDTFIDSIKLNDVALTIDQWEELDNIIDERRKHFYDKLEEEANVV